MGDHAVCGPDNRPRDSRLGTRSGWGGHPPQASAGVEGKVGKPRVEPQRASWMELVVDRRKYVGSMTGGVAPVCSLAQAVE